MEKRDIRTTMRYPNVRYTMAQKRISISELAKKMGISYNALRGKLEGTSRFYLDEVKKVSSILDIPFAELSEEID